MKTVLILAFECAPHHRQGSTVGALRPHRFAKYLPKYGWQAIVLCCNQESRWKIPSGEAKSVVRRIIHDRLSSSSGADSIIIPLPSLEYADVIDRMWLSTVEIDRAMGTFVAKTGPCNIMIRKLWSFIKIFRGDYSQSWQRMAWFGFEFLQEVVKIDCVISEHGPDASLFVGKKIAERLSIPWVLDFRDPILQPLPRLIRPFYTFYLRNLTRQSKLVISVNDHLGKLDSKIFKKDSIVVLNSFDKDDFSFRPILKKSPEESVKILYVGGIYSPYQSIDSFFRSIALLEEARSRIHFHYIGNASDYVRAHCRKHNVDDLCTIEDHKPREQIFLSYQDADFVLILSMNHLNDIFYADGLYPGKFFEYLASGRPILCISEFDGMLERAIKLTGAGLIFRNPFELSEFLKTWIEFPSERLKLLPRRDNTEIDKFSSEHSIKVLAKKLSLLASESS